MSKQVVTLFKILKILSEKSPCHACAQPSWPCERKNQYCQFLVCSSGDISCLCKQTCFFYFYFSSFTQLVSCHNAVLLFSLSKNPSLWLHKVFPPFLKAKAYSIPQIYSNFIYLVNGILLVFLSNHSIHISLEGVIICWWADQVISPRRPVLIPIAHWNHPVSRF